MKEIKRWVGRKFGKLTVVSETGTVDRGSCLCSCECGNEIKTKKALLKKGSVRSCGCLSKDHHGSYCQKQDLKGRKIGRLLVRRKGNSTETKNKYFCICDCGNMKWVNYDSLVAGTVKSCGCLRQEMYDEKRRHPLDVGDRFGRLVVLEIYKDGPTIMCKCQCDCGQITHVRKSNLVREGNGTRSCGCLNREISKEVNTVHGLGNDRLYRICWQAVDRVVKKRSGSSAGYYQLGIEEDWAKDPVLMRNELKPLYDACVSINGEADATLDRIDNSLGYYRDNVRFISRKEQHQNMSPRKDQYCFMAINIETKEKYCCNNIRGFAKYSGANHTNIWKCLSGKGKSSGGFTYVRLDGKCYSDGKKIDGSWQCCLKKLDFFAKPSDPKVKRCASLSINT